MRYNKFMFRNLIKIILANYISLFVISTYLIPSFVINNGWSGYTKTVIVLTLIFPLLRPILKVLLLPITIITLGLVNFFLDVILIYFLTILIPEVRILPQTFSSFDLGSVHIAAFTLGRFWVMVLVSFLLTVLTKFIRWLLK